MADIIRTPTEKEINLAEEGFIPIVNPSKSKKTVQEEFNERLAQEAEKANKKGLPFCDRAAKDDFKEGYDLQAKKSLRANGYVKPEDIKPVKMDWAKYSDLKNFEIVEEGETSDEYLTKKNPGLDVTIKKTIYKFEGYSNRYTIMEDAPSAIRRARDKLKELNEATTKKK